MPAPFRKSPAKIQRLMELHRQGASAREIADALDIGSHVTAIKWLRDAGLTPNGGHGPRSGRQRSQVNGLAGKLAGAQEELAALASGPAPKDLDEVLQRLREDFQQVRALALFHLKRAGEGESTMAELQKAIELEEKFATKIRELTPRAPPNPDEDPTNMQAAAEVRRKFAMLVETAERELRCKHCGHAPF